MYYAIELQINIESIAIYHIPDEKHQYRNKGNKLLKMIGGMPGRQNDYFPIYLV
jgi:hypothetical protein